MSGFAFNAPSTTENAEILNDEFFPNITLDQVRKGVRFDGSITNERLKDSIIDAMLEVNKQLKSLKQKANRINDLATSMIDGIADTEHQYRKAIYSAVSADINEKYQSYDSSEAGQKRAEELKRTIDEQRRNLRWAIRDLLGINRCTVDLI